MKKVNCLLLVFSIICSLMLASCGSDDGYKRNENYTYGTLSGVDNIETVYELVGSPSVGVIDNYTDGVSAGKKGSYTVKMCETACGGIVAYGEGIYVYSPNKADKNSVRSAFINECVQNNKD